VHHLFSPTGFHFQFVETGSYRNNFRQA
jgi:hypothetical protein